jgi:hypothetical protein
MANVHPMRRYDSINQTRQTVIHTQAYQYTATIAFSYQGKKEEKYGQQKKDKTSVSLSLILLENNTPVVKLPLITIR